MTNIDLEEITKKVIGISIIEGLKDSSQRLDVHLVGLNSEETIKIEQQVYKHAKKLFYDHYDIILKMPLKFKSDLGNFWLVHPALVKQDRFNHLFNMYFVSAKLRFVLDRKKLDITSSINLRKEEVIFINNLAEEYSVHFLYVSQKNLDLQVENGMNFGGDKGNIIRKIKSLINSDFTSEFVFYIMQPLFKNYYRKKFDSRDIWFSIHETKPHKRRYGNTFEKIDRKYGFFYYSNQNVVKTGSLIKSILKKDTVLIDWFLSPKDQRKLRKEAKLIKSKIINYEWNCGSENKFKNEFYYIVTEISKVQQDKIYNILKIAHAYEAFLNIQKHKVIVCSQPLTNFDLRLLAVATKKYRHTLISVAPHFYSVNRLTNTFSIVERKYDFLVLPDYYFVENQLSKWNLVLNGIEESRIFIRKQKNKKTDLINKNTSTKFKVLFVLQMPYENESILRIITQFLEENNIEGIEFVIQPHPAYPLTVEQMMIVNELTTLYNGKIEVVGSKISIENTINECDICVSVYSTATFYAASVRKPVVWIPFVSKNYLFYEEVYNNFGIMTYDVSNFRKIILKLCTDRLYYHSNSIISYQFSKKNDNIAFQVDLGNFIDDIINQEE
ncbi:hypothetical protein AB3Z07_24535 [Metabacillus halosaccharovorans]|uniref:hypothetical protein n=1 Tax=Metabacillus halosaccharovorans TaxID=930124 RepID=UPI0034CF75E6